MSMDMKGDWDRRARTNAPWFIATSVEGGQEEFDASGRRDVGYFFDGLEELLHDEQDVLDIGCGIGRMDGFVAPHVRSLVGIDVSGEMVRKAAERLASLDNVRFVEGDGWTLQPLGDATLGLVISHICFQHMPRRVVSSYFAEVSRVLRTGGDFVFQMPEANADSPADPPDEDTFGMRFYEEQPLREELAGVGLEWQGARRFEVEAPNLTFNQLRIHVRKRA